MNKSTYDKINEYCTTRYEGVLVQAERDFILRRFLDSYYQAIETHTQEHNAVPTEAEEQMIVNSLLNDSTMQSYIDSAKVYFRDLSTNIENDYKRRQNAPSFWVNVGISIVANIIYSLFLIIIFIVAKDQITSWLSQLTS